MHRPFEILDEWVRKGRIRLVDAPLVLTNAPEEELSPSNDEIGPETEESAETLPCGLGDDELFAFAMRNVKSLGWSAVPLAQRPPIELQPQDGEQEALRLLEEFIQNGDIRLEQTAEYIEGSVHPHGRLYLDDLRSGRFSIQAHLDLHGLTPEVARFVLDEFILESVQAGFRCVRVIHGRGRHSIKHHSVLKENVQKWLATRRMSRHVVAYSSARRCDGGGGAVYVLLRR